VSDRVKVGILARVNTGLRHRDPRSTLPPARQWCGNLSQGKYWIATSIIIEVSSQLSCGDVGILARVNTGLRQCLVDKVNPFCPNCGNLSQGKYWIATRIPLYSRNF